MYPESLGTHAIQGNFNFVAVQVIEGRYLPDRKTNKANPITNGGQFFIEVKEQFFDKTYVDIAVMEEIRKTHRTPHPTTTVEGIIELASYMALNHANVSDGILGKNIQERRLDKLLSYDIPSKLEWERNVEGQPYPLPLFIERVVPFLRTRDWLFNKEARIRRADSDRFIAAITITRRPAMVAV